MDATDLARWTRFAVKGGIGKCTAIQDCVAERLEDLMFLKDDGIIVLLQLPEENQYLGFCEGVVGRFSGSAVQFHGKLKKPVLAKRQSGVATSPSRYPLSEVQSSVISVSRPPSPLELSPSARSDSRNSETGLVKDTNKADTRDGSTLENDGSRRERDPKPSSASEKQDREQTIEHPKNLTEDGSGIDVIQSSVSAPNPALVPHPAALSSGTTRTPPLPQTALLKVKDVDGKYIDIPVYEPLHWQKLCDFLVEKQVLAKQHLLSGECVVYTPDDQVLLDQEWDNWITDAIVPSDDNTPPQLQVELRIVRKFCCGKLSERDQAVCNNCSTPLFDMVIPPDVIEPVPIPMTNTPYIETHRSLTNDTPDELHGKTTAINITYTSENSVVRRRKWRPSSEESGEEQRSSPLQQEDAENSAITGNEGPDVNSRSNTLYRVVHVLLTLYLYLIKPPFIALPGMMDDISYTENLDFHLSFLQSWILGIDICLLGGAWAVSALTTASQSPILQTFVQLSASFAFFGIVFGLLLSYNIGMMKESFVQWISQNRWNPRSESWASVWNPIIMLILPLTWTGWYNPLWAILSTVLFILLYAWNSDPSGSPSVAKNTPGAFTSFIIGLSVLYAIMIQWELSKCYRQSLKPRIRGPDVV